MRGRDRSALRASVGCGAEVVVATHAAARRATKTVPATAQEPCKREARIEAAGDAGPHPRRHGSVNTNSGQDRLQRRRTTGASWKIRRTRRRNPLLQESCHLLGQSRATDVFPDTQDRWDRQQGDRNRHQCSVEDLQAASHDRIVSCLKIPGGCSGCHRRAIRPLPKSHPPAGPPRLQPNGEDGCADGGVAPLRKTTRHKLAMFFLSLNRSRARAGRPPGAGG